tara:strand:+ start:2312 stop:3988 length:1677 start_codon:yes stop_codon:yes gene_type:complete
MNNFNNQITLSKDQINAVMSLYSSGQFNEAIKSIKELNEEYPNVPLLFNILGACYKAIGEIDGALQMFEIATKIKPNYAEAFFNLALTHHELNQIDTAIIKYKKALEINSEYPDAHNNLGILYLNSKNFEEAVKHFEFAITHRPDYAEAYNNLGSTFQELNQIEKALLNYKKSITINKNYSQAYNNLGILQQKVGDNAAALLNYENAIKTQPYNASAHHNISSIKQYTSEDKQFCQMKNLLNSSDIKIADKSRLFFALAKAYEDLNQTEDFFECLEEGNRLRKKDLSFSYEESEMNYNLFIKELFKKTISKIDRESNYLYEKRPIFILGMPRSGTSLVEQIISSHHKVHGGGELYNLTEILVPILQDALNNDNNFLIEEKVSLVGSNYIEKLNKLNVNENIVTDKWPLNFRHIGFILSAFPDAKIIHLKRDPVATCWSIYKHYFADNGNGWAYDFDDLTKFYDAYVDLMEYWHSLYPNKIYDLSYDELTVNQEEETRNLLDYCDLSWDKNCLSFYENKRPVLTASASQVRKKMYKGSSNDWKKYKNYLVSLSKHFENK